MSSRACLGARRGWSLAGLIGGMTSSTAVTLAMGERTRRNAQPALAGVGRDLVVRRDDAARPIGHVGCLSPLGMRLLLPSSLMVLGYLIFGVVLWRARKERGHVEGRATARSR